MHKIWGKKKSVDFDLPKSVDQIQLKTNLESAINRLMVENKASIDGDFRDEIKQATHAFLKASKSICSSRSNQALHNTPLKLSRKKT